MHVILHEIGITQADFRLIDTPGQSEIFIFRPTGPTIVSAFRDIAPTIGVYLIDPHLAETPTSLAAVFSLSMASQLRLGIPMVNVLNKVDIVKRKDLGRLMEDHQYLKRQIEKEGAGAITDLAIRYVEATKALAKSQRLIRVSAKTGRGMKQLYDIIHESLCECGDLTNSYERISRAKGRCLWSKGKGLRAMDVEFKGILIQIILLSIVVISSQSFIVVQSTEDYSSILDNISVERIISNTKRLVDFKTRYIFTPECNASAAFLYDDFSNLEGYDVRFDYFNVMRRASENFTAMNVVASRKGTVNENETIIVCAHYDSYSGGDPDVSAPGANDNAAGIAVVMEVAYILSTFSLNRTIVFIAFSSEEFDLQGSMNWVAKNTEILKSTIGVICLDGIARGEAIAVMFTLEESSSLARYVCNIARKLGYQNFYARRVGAVGSDSDSFEMKGVRAVRFWDWDTTFIHTSDDTLETLDGSCIKRVADVTCITTYKLATEALDGVFVSIARGPSNGFLILVGAITASVIVVISLIIIGCRWILKQRR